MAIKRTTKARGKSRRALRSSGKAKPAPNPMRYDPTRTLTLRRAFSTALEKQFALLKGRIAKKIQVEDALGLLVVGNVNPNHDEKGRFASSSTEDDAGADRIPRLPHRFGPDYQPSVEEGVHVAKSAEPLEELYAAGAEQYDFVRDGPFSLKSVEHTDPKENKYGHFVQLVTDGDRYGVELLDCKNQITAAAFGVGEDKARGAYKQVAERQKQEGPLTRNLYQSFVHNGRVGWFPVVNMVEVPNVQQSDASSCGAAAAMSVGRYFNVGPKTQAEWKDKLGTTAKDGTNVTAIVAYLKGLGLDVRPMYGMTIDQLRQETDAGRPVICSVQDYGAKGGWSNGHYLVVVGVDDGYVFAQDPSQQTVAGSLQKPGRVMVSEDDWLEAWHDEDADGKKYVRFGIAVGPREVTANFDPDQSRDEHGRWEAVAEEAVHKASAMFGLPRSKVNIVRDPEQNTFGEHGGDTVHLVNVHEGKPINKQLNFKADRHVSEGEHIAAHEVAHQAYSADVAAGQEAMHSLSKVNAEYGKGVSIYGAFGGDHENLMELGASYLHSPAALKRYSPEMHAIAEKWVNRVRSLHGKPPTTNFNPAHDALGLFASTAGAVKGVVGGGRGTLAGMRIAGTVVKKIGEAEHWTKDKTRQAVAKLPKPVRTAVLALYRATLASYTATQAVAERVAKERGLDDEHARRLRGVLATVDAVLAKPVALAGHHIPGVGAALGFVPAASAGYLLYSTSRNPLATWRAASGLVRDHLDRLTGSMLKGVTAFNANPYHDESGKFTTADEAKSFLSEWTFGKEGVDTGGMFKVVKPSTAVIQHLATARPSQQITVYRSHRAGAKHESYESWTIHKELAEAITEDDPTRITLRKNVNPSEILYHADYLPSDLKEHALDGEVVIAHDAAGKMAKVRGESLSRGQQGFTLNAIENADADKVAAALDRHDFDDWYVALLHAALAEGLGIDDAIATADQLHKKAPNGPVGNATLNAADWAPLPDHDKVVAFQQWLKSQVQDLLTSKSQEALWERYANEGFKRGAGRAFDDVRQSQLAKKHPEYFTEQGQKTLQDFYKGTKSEFLQSAFAHPVSVEKVKLLAGRSFDELEGMTGDMSLKLTRELTDGLVEGASPRKIAADMSDALDISKNRALLIAKTEIIRTHAEGQLEALERLGVEEVGVSVEFSTTGDGNVCADCAALEGIVLKLDEAHGLIPVHPACRCSFIPANVGEDDEGQIRDKEDIDDAADDAGVDLDVDEDRPESILNVSHSQDGAVDAGAVEDVGVFELWRRKVSLSINRFFATFNPKPNPSSGHSPSHSSDDPCAAALNRSFFADCERDEHGHCLPEGGAGGEILKRVSEADLRSAQAKARGKIKAAPKPSPEEAAEAQRRIAKDGNDKYRKATYGNSTDRAKSREKLVEEFSHDGGHSCPCVYCGLKLTTDNVSRDRIYTLHEGGKYRQANLLPACLSCNSRRQDVPITKVKWLK